MGKEVKLQRNESAGSNLVTVPAQWVRMKGWEKGDTLEWSEEKGNLILRKSD